MGETSTLNSAITLLVDSHGFLEYVDAVLLDERSSLNNQYVFQFLYIFFPKVSDQVLTDQVKNLIQSLCQHLHTVSNTFDLSKQMSVKQLNGDLRALVLVQAGVKEIDKEQLKESVRTLKQRTQNQLKDLSPEIEKSEVKDNKNVEEKSDVKNDVKSEGESDEKKGDRQSRGSRGSTDNRGLSGAEGKDSTVSTSGSSIKKLSPLQKLKETLTCFDKSLDMLYADLIKEDTTDKMEITEEMNKDNQDQNRDGEAGTSAT